MEIARYTSQLFVMLEQVAEHLREAERTLLDFLQRERNTLKALGRRAANKPRELQEALLARENALENVLATSSDAIAVTNSARQLIAANPKALELFGVSATNMGKFTIDAFLSPGQILEFDRNGSPFRSPKARNGACEVRRLDGSLRVAEYSFIANFVPFRHLYQFRKVVAMNQYQPATLRTVGDCGPVHLKYDIAN